ncbi:MAG: hypothetical protein EP330_11300 [Deltaproteobacteria bacterium]|nr:MAG: hypothetical protein EP330_11300 [Deltaproteobacteria bacterium]
MARLTMLLALVGCVTEGGSDDRCARTWDETDVRVRECASSADVDGDDWVPDAAACGSDDEQPFDRRASDETVLGGTIPVFRAVSLDGEGPRIVREAGGVVEVSLELAMECAGEECGTAVRQILLGVGGRGHADACVHDGVGSTSGFVRHTALVDIPDAPGVYPIRYAHTQAPSCEEAGDAWWRLRSISPTTTLAVVEVVDTCARQLVDTGAPLDETPDTGWAVDTGLEDTGIEDTGVEDTGIEDTGLEDTGIDDTPKDTGPLGEPVPAECEELGLSGSTYAFCQASRGALEAAEVCASAGMHLVKVDDYAENSWLQDRIRERAYGATWHGYSDADVEGLWRWHDGTTGSFTRWNYGEPNNVGGGGEDCAVFRGAGDGTWNDVPCSGARPFVCEREEAR